MSILERLGLTRSPQPEEAGDTESVRRIARALESLPAGQARYLAAFAFLLGRVAHADLDISDAETRRMEETVRLHGHLGDAEAVLVVEIAKSQNRLFGGTENFLVARELRQVTTPEQRRELLDSLFAVSAADDSVSLVEEEEIRQISRELGLTHREYVDARAARSAQREVLRPLLEKAAEESETASTRPAGPGLPVRGEDRDGEA